MLLLCLQLYPLTVQAVDYAASIESAELRHGAAGYYVEAHIEYHLSPMAKEALHKGVPLAWNVQIELREPGLFRDNVILKHTLVYSLQFHALLNQYAVQRPLDHSEMFLTLSAALNYMASVHDNSPIPANLVQADKPYILAVQTQFNREFLPIPLRPVAYLDHRWFLSSAWHTWPIQK